MILTYISDAAGNDSQEKFSSLLEAANIAKEQVQKTLGKRPATDGAQSVAKRTRSSGTESPEKGAGDTPRHSLRSGRAVSTRFLEGIASLKPKTASKGKDEKGKHASPTHTLVLISKKNVMVKLLILSYPPVLTCFGCSKEPSQ